MIGKSEQLVLYIRTLHLLSSALRLAKDELEESRLRPSAAVKKVGGCYHAELHFL